MNPAALLNLLALAAIWGASFLFMRQLVPAIGVMPTAFFRVFLSAVGLVVILLAMRTRWDFRGKLGRILLIGVISSGIPVLMYSLAAQFLPAGYSAIFNATTPLMGVLIGSLLFGEALTGAKSLGVLLGLAGVAVLTRAGPAPFDAGLLWGAAACLVATTCYASPASSPSAGSTTRAGWISAFLPLAARPARRCACCRSSSAPAWTCRWRRCWNRKSCWPWPGWVFSARPSPMSCTSACWPASVR